MASKIGRLPSGRTCTAAGGLSSAVPTEAIRTKGGKRSTNLRAQPGKQGPQSRSTRRK